MNNFDLWNIETEKSFFINSLRTSTPEKIFYDLRSGYFAYVAKGVDGERKTLQSRNTLIGNFTEKWAKEILAPIASELGLYAVNGVVCDQVGLPRSSRADVALCKTNSTTQTAENIKAIFEVKMSIISNYKYEPQDQTIEYLGDYKSHKGIPSLLRSDSMLKAIGKAINIKVSCVEATKIPIIVLGNSPITEHYFHKVDNMKTSGVIQGFWSLHPNPIETNYIKNTTKFGFQTIENYDMLKMLIKDLLNTERHFFSSMISKGELGKVIAIANQENTEIEKAEKFLELIRM